MGRRSVADIRCRFDDTDATGSRSIELSGLKGQVEARSVAEIPALLTEVEAAVGRGWSAGGFVAYEAAPAFDTALAVRSGEASPGPDPGLPLAWFGFFAESRGTSPLPHLVDPDRNGNGDEGLGAAAWSSEIDGSAHQADVAAIRESIAKGDAYLVNYTTRFRRAWNTTEDPFQLYAQLVAGHATGHHAYLETPDWVVACGSPELFFELDSGQLTTRPMKGTAPRGRWSQEDAERGEALRTSVKERAENVMVVDLLRNDLGRIAIPGSVQVPALWRVERHPTLWQLTSTVTAQARPHTSLGDVFAALFPSGSVTGAPKVSAMHIISELERSPRGVYCGAVGLVQAGTQSSGGVSARFAVAIRTAVIDRPRRLVEYGSGGGITWDSSAAAEWDEILTKTKALTNPAEGIGAGHGLLETMGFDPALGLGINGVRNLQRHLNRLAASADYFGLPAPVAARGEIAAAVADLQAPARVRVVYSPDGTTLVEAWPLIDDTIGPGSLRLCIDSEPVSSTDIGLFHKTTDRRRYDERTDRHPRADDVVLVNERGEVTETTRANLAVSVDGRWMTPSLDCGLLPGIGRADLLASGRLAEGVVTLGQLHQAEEVAIFSSLRGWRSVALHPDCPCSQGDNQDFR